MWPFQHAKAKLQLLEEENKRLQARAPQRRSNMEEDSAFNRRVVDVKVCGVFNHSVERSRCTFSMTIFNIVERDEAQKDNNKRRNSFLMKQQYRGEIKILGKNVLFLCFALAF